MTVDRMRAGLPTVVAFPTSGAACVEALTVAPASGAARGLQGVLRGAGAAR